VSAELIPTFDKSPSAPPRWRAELLTTDLKGSVAFYNELFGWTLRRLGPHRTFSSSGPTARGPVVELLPLEGAEQSSWWPCFLLRDVQRVVDLVGRLGGSLDADVNIGDASVLVGADSTGLRLLATIDDAGSDSVSTVPRFELVTSSIEHASAFYREAFGLFFEPAAGMGALYSTIAAGESEFGGASQVIASTDVLTGWVPYFAVPDLESAVSRARRLGAAAVVNESPSLHGRFAVLDDVAGARFGLIAPSGTAGRLR
jgi:predicted enzyme related to lactoylglutathione lyase